MSLGIRQIFVVSAPLVIASSVVLQTTGLQQIIALNQRVQIEAVLYFSIAASATGGFRGSLAYSAGFLAFAAGQVIVNCDGNTEVNDTFLAPGVTSSPLGFNLGPHMFRIDAMVLNAGLAGLLDIQIAQNVSDPAALTLLPGSFMKTLIF